MRDIEEIKAMNELAVKEGEEAVLNKVQVNPVPSLPHHLGADTLFDVSFPSGAVYTNCSPDFISKTFPEISPNLFPHFNLSTVTLHLKDGRVITIRLSGLTSGEPDIDQSDRLHLAASLHNRSYKLAKYNAQAFKNKLANAPAGFLVSLANFLEDIETS